MSDAEIQKQVEYYLSDGNLSKDDFFRTQIKSNKDGYLNFECILKCNKVKKMGVSAAAQLSKAVKDSKLVEISKDGKSVRRVGNKALPEQTGSLKKRDVKADDKNKSNTAQVVPEKDEAPVKVERNEAGQIIFVQQDFENTLIVHFKTTDIDEAADGEYKVNWKDLSKVISDRLDQIKVVYSRGDKYEGDIAVSSFKLDKVQFAELVQWKDIPVGEVSKKFSFSETKGEDLKEFWQKQGGHFQYCIAAKLRLARKNSRKVQEAKREEKSKRQKQSFTIAEVYYTDINKVKSKSKAILNIKKDGETLDQPDEEFMKEILRFHDNHDGKMKEFDHFEVGCHPEFTKTRCFFSVNKSGAKEDFSVAKCINNLEARTNEAAQE